MTMRDMGKNWDTLAFCKSLSISREEFEERIADIKDKRKNRGYSRWTPQVFMSQLKKEDIATLQEELFLFRCIENSDRFDLGRRCATFDELLKITMGNTGTYATPRLYTNIFDIEHTPDHESAFMASE